MGYICEVCGSDNWAEPVEEYSHDPYARAMGCEDDGPHYYHASCYENRTMNI